MPFFEDNIENFSKPQQYKALNLMTFYEEPSSIKYFTFSFGTSLFLYQ